MDLIKALATVVSALWLTGCAQDAVPRDQLTLVGSINLLPGPDAPFRPSFAELLVDEAGTETWVARATGNGEGVALLCGRDRAAGPLSPETRSQLQRVDFVLMTRALAPLERSDCTERGTELAERQIARYVGPRTRPIEGIWIVWIADQAQRTSETASLLETALTRTPLLLRDGVYATLFRPL